MLGNPDEHIAQASLGIQAVQIGRANQRVHRRRTLTTRIGPGEQSMQECRWREAVGDICHVRSRDLHKRVAASGVGGRGGPRWKGSERAAGSSRRTTTHFTG